MPRNIVASKAAAGPVNTSNSEIVAVLTPHVTDSLSTMLRLLKEESEEAS